MTSLWVVMSQCAEQHASQSSRRSGSRRGQGGGIRLSWALCLVAIFGGLGVVSARQVPELPRCSDRRDYPVTVLFVNGIWNSDADAQGGCDALAGLLGSKGVTGVNVGRFYNRSRDAAWGECMDAIQEGRNREAQGEIVAWGPSSQLAPTRSGPEALTNPQEARRSAFVEVPIWALQRGCDQPSDVIEARSQLVNARRNYPREPQPDARRLREAIVAELQAGRRVVVVAHSQGNLMFQEAVFGGPGLTEEIRRSVGWIAVAGPYINMSPNLTAFGSVIFDKDPLNLLLESQTTPLETELSRLRAHFLDSYLGDQRVQREVVRVVSAMLPPPPIVATTSGQRVLLVLDVSGSMANANKMAIAQNAANDLLDRLAQGTEVGIMAFGEVVPGDGCSVSEAQFTTDITALRQTIGQLQSGGATPLAKAMSKAAAVASSTRQDVALHVIVITDGLETCQRTDGIDPVDAARALGLELRLISGTP